VARSSNASWKCTSPDADHHLREEMENMARRYSPSSSSRNSTSSAEPTNCGPPGCGPGLSEEVRTMTRRVWSRSQKALDSFPFTQFMYVVNRTTKITRNHHIVTGPSSEMKLDEDLSNAAVYRAYQDGQGVWSRTSIPPGFTGLCASPSACRCAMTTMKSRDSRHGHPVRGPAN